MFPTKQNHTVDLPEEFYGLEVEIIAFPLTEKRRTQTDPDKFYNSINLDFSGFKFDRDEANERSPLCSCLKLL